MSEDLTSLAAHRRAVESAIPLLEGMQSIAEMALRVAQRAVAPMAAYSDELTDLFNAVVSTLDPAAQAEAARITGSGPAAVMLIGSERGLCGTLNESLVSRVRTLLESDTPLICFGARAIRAARSARCRVDLAIPLPSLRLPGYAELEKMTYSVLEFVEQQNVSRLQVVYPAPGRGLQYAVTSEQLLPPRPHHPAAKRTAATEIKPAADTATLLLQLVSEQVLTDLDRMLTLAAVSEQLARVAAMRMAADNAHRLLEDLTVQYNVARQHAITQSLLEIVTGYEAALRT